MTPETNQSSVPPGHFAPTTLLAIVNVARNDVQKIESAIATAIKMGAPTAHWTERLRQTTNVLTVALKEYQTRS